MQARFPFLIGPDARNRLNHRGFGSQRARPIDVTATYHLITQNPVFGPMYGNAVFCLPSAFSGRSQPDWIGAKIEAG